MIDSISMNNETTTCLPSVADPGTRITIKSCNGNALTNVISPKKVYIQDSDDLLPGHWVLVDSSPSSLTYVMEPSDD